MVVAGGRSCLVRQTRSGAPGMLRQFGVADRLGTGERHRIVVLHRRAGHADRARHLAAGIDDRDTAREGDQPVIRVLDAVERAAGLRQAADRPVIMPKNTAVFAFFCAMSIEPTQAPSIRWNAFRLPPESTTAMHICVPSATALSGRRGSRSRPVRSSHACACLPRHFVSAATEFAPVRPSLATIGGPVSARTFVRRIFAVLSARIESFGSWRFSEWSRAPARRDDGLGAAGERASDEKIGRRFSITDSGAADAARTESRIDAGRARPVGPSSGVPRRSCVTRHTSRCSVRASRIGPAYPPLRRAVRRPTRHGGRYRRLPFRQTS